MAKKGDAGLEITRGIRVVLEAAYARAEAVFNEPLLNELLLNEAFPLNEALKCALDELSEKSGQASAVFTNVVTCLAIKSANESIDMRYHQVQIQQFTDRPAGFNFRGVSEQTIAPWLSNKNFEGAQSGWQTRTLERPKPYTRAYDENISYVKDAFLSMFEEVEENLQSAAVALSYIFYKQIILRESKSIILSTPKTNDIDLIIKLLRQHFFYNYKASKGASRLPVLALYALYEIMMPQLARYDQMELRPLQSHSAADSQTGAIGDIEVYDSRTDTIFEAIEVKHGIGLNEAIIQSAARKIMDKSVDRYYILTTHENCEPTGELVELISTIRELHHCQLIANGLISSIKYYLRTISNPSLIFDKYVHLLSVDKAIKHEHREVWNSLATSLRG